MNLGSLLVQTLPIALEGKATGGSTSTIPDTTLTGKFDDDSFKDGMAFVRVTTDGLAPVGQYSLITGYVDSSGEFTVSPVFSAAVGSGDYYAIADPVWNLYTVLRLVNQGLRRFGVISLVDTSITAAAQTLEYTLPLALKAFPLDKVELGNATDGWEELSDWYVLPATAGSQGKLVFNYQPDYDGATAANQTFRLWYRDYHPNVDTYDDVISETIPEPLAIQYVKNELMDYLMQKDGRISEDMMRRFQISRGDLQDARANNRINTANRKISKFLSIRDMHTGG
jgi:hypothetical protein